MIEEIESKTLGIQINNMAIPILLFSDDAVLLAKDETEAQTQLNQVNAYLQKLGMSLSVPKCATFQIVHKDKTWYMKDPKIKIQEEEIASINADMMLLYLGTKIFPWGALNKGSEVPIITKAIQNVKRLHLKPQQKLELIQRYVLPHFVYNLIINAPARGTLQLLDSEIRRIVKEILHLPLSIANGFLYTPKGDGGLGLMKLQNVVQLAVIRNNIRMKESQDPIVKSIAQGETSRETINRYCRDLRIPNPEKLADINKAKSTLKNREVINWQELKTQGHGVQHYQGDKIGNRWLVTPGLLKGSRFIDAIKMRTNTFGTRVVISRTKRGMDITCRKCGLARETLGHILGLCIHTKVARIKRHNDIRDFIANKVSQRKPVFVEPTVNEYGELKRPDIVVKNGNQIEVVDITVRYERGDYLEQAAKEKIDKYKNTAELIRIRTGCEKSEVLPIVVGSRGVIPLKTKTALQQLGLNRQEMLTISLMALRSSTEIANAFIDYD